MEPLSVEGQSLLDLRGFVTEFPQALGEMHSTAELLKLLCLDAAAPLKSSEEVRLAVRDLLRLGGFKPTGRNKPASEYLIKAASDGTLAAINLAVDVCNIVSLHSGLPISVVDIDKAREPFGVGIAPPGSEYVFNGAGQVIRLDGLLCLFDADGPCGNAVKDSQRTKTTPDTVRTLSLIWGTSALPNRATETEQWYRSLLQAQGADVGTSIVVKWNMLDSRANPPTEVGETRLLPERTLRWEGGTLRFPNRLGRWRNGI